MVNDFFSSMSFGCPYLSQLTHRNEDCATGLVIFTLISILNLSFTLLFMPKKIRFIVNPGSGILPKFNLESNVRSIFCEPQYYLEYIISEYPGHPAVLAREAIEKSVDIVVAAGGDGTVSEVAAELVGTGVKMGIVPGGSGNGIATKLGIPRLQGEALQIISRGKIMEADAPRVNGKYFFSQCSQGFEALVAHRFAGAKFRGFLRYASLVVQNYFQYRDRQYSIFLNERVITESMFFWEITNSGSLGYGIQTVPKAAMNDGQLELFVVKSFPKYWILPMAFLLLINKLLWSRYVMIIPCTAARVLCNEDHYLQIDGDPLAEHREVNVHLGPEKWKVIVP